MSTAPVFKSREDLERTRQQQQHAERVKIGLEECYAVRFNGTRGKVVLKPTQATAKEIILSCAEFSGVAPSVCVPSAFVLEQAFKYNHEIFMERLGTMLYPVEVLRKEIIEEIANALRTRGSMTEWNIQQERTRLNNGFTLQKLRNRLSYILEAQRLAGWSVPELKEGIQVTRAAQAPLPKLLPEEITAEVIKKAHPEQIKRWCQIYGERQVNARLQGR